MAKHILGPRQYGMVFLALIVLTAATVGTSRLDLGLFHTWLGLAFAVAKALLVVLFFMHLLHSTRLTWIVAGSGVFFLVILISFTLMDYITRTQGTPVQSDMQFRNRVSGNELLRLLSKKDRIHGVEVSTEVPRQQ